MAVKRSIFLINPKFQIKLSLYVSILLLISSLIYPVTIYELMTSFITYASKTTPSLSDNLAEKKQTLILYLSLWQLGFVGLVFISCIFFTHKIAGPMYKLQKYLRAIRDGQNYGDLYFRNGDYFKEVADDFNLTFGEIQENYKKDFVYLSEVSTYINNLALVVPEDKKVVLLEINKKLSEIQSRFNS